MVKELQIDLMKFIKETDEKIVVVIPINCFINAKGLNIMGAGFARQVKELVPTLPYIIGQNLSQFGCEPRIVAQLSNITFATLPTKPDFCNENQLLPLYRKQKHSKYANPGWMAKSDISFIKKQILLLKKLAEKLPALQFYIPRPGSGKGGLDWHTEVKPELSKPLYDSEQFIYVTYPKKGILDFLI